MALADMARSFEIGINRRGIVRHRRHGWLPKILPYMGYGSTASVRILARAVMADPDARHDVSAQRGFHQFFTTQVGFLPVTVKVGERVIRTRTDSSGYVDILVANHGLEPGVHSALLTPAQGMPATAPVQILNPHSTIGIISDVDDTVMVTKMPRAFIAAWNAFVLNTDARQEVPGMSEFYQSLIQRYPSAPFFYLSTGAWNTEPAINAFLQQHGFPLGPIVLTDWGPTPTGLIRNGMEHKRTQLRNLLISFPHMRWILIGDDGQHDPYVYEDLAREHPDRVAAIAIRELSPVEQVFSHGTPRTLDISDPIIARHFSVPEIRGKDGFELHAQWDTVAAALASASDAPLFAPTTSPHSASSEECSGEERESTR